MPEESSIAGDGRRKERKMGRCNLKYNVLMQKKYVMHCMTCIVARMSGHS